MPSKKKDHPAPSNALALAAMPAAEDPPATAEAVLQQFRIVLNAVKTHFQQVERKAGIGGAPLWALTIIREQPGIGVGDLAIALSVRPPTASIIVRTLSLQGFVEPSREGPDRRSVQLHITTEGRKLLRRAPRPFAGVLPEALRALEPATLDLLNRGLRELVPLLDADVRATATPLSLLSASD